MGLRSDWMRRNGLTLLADGERLVVVCRVDPGNPSSLFVANSPYLYGAPNAGMAARIPPLASLAVVLTDRRMLFARRRLIGPWMVEAEYTPDEVAEVDFKPASFGNGTLYLTFADESVEIFSAPDRKGAALLAAVAQRSDRRS